MKWILAHTLVTAMVIGGSVLAKPSGHQSQGPQTSRIPEQVRQLMIQQLCSTKDIADCKKRARECMNLMDSASGLGRGEEDISTMCPGISATDCYTKVLECSDILKRIKEPSGWGPTEGGPQNGSPPRRGPQGGGPPGRKANMLHQHALMMCSTSDMPNCLQEVTTCRNISMALMVTSGLQSQSPDSIMIAIPDPSMCASTDIPDCQSKVVECITLIDNLMTNMPQPPGAMGKPPGYGPQGLGQQGGGPPGGGPQGWAPDGGGPPGSGPQGWAPNRGGPPGSGLQGWAPNGGGPPGSGPQGWAPNGGGPPGSGPQGWAPNRGGPPGSGPQGVGPQRGGPLGIGPAQFMCFASEIPNCEEEVKNCLIMRMILMTASEKENKLANPMSFSAPDPSMCAATSIIGCESKVKQCNILIQALMANMVASPGGMTSMEESSDESLEEEMEMLNRPAKDGMIEIRGSGYRKTPRDDGGGGRYKKSNREKVKGQQPNGGNREGQRHNDGNKKGQRPNGGNRERQKPNGGNRDGHRPNGGNREEPRPNGGNREGQRPNGGNREGQRPNGGNREGHRPNGGNREGQRPNGGNRDGQKPNGGIREGQRPNGGNRESHRPNGGNREGQRPNGGSREGQRPNGGNREGQRPNGGNREGHSPIGGNWEGQTPNGGNWEGYRPNDGDWEGYRPNGGNWEGQSPNGGNWEGQSHNGGNWQGYTPNDEDWEGHKPNGGNWEEHRPNDGDWEGQSPNSGNWEGQSPNGGNWEGHRPNDGDWEGYRPNDEHDTKSEEYEEEGIEDEMFGGHREKRADRGKGKGDKEYDKVGEPQQEIMKKTDLKEMKGKQKDVMEKHEEGGGTTRDINSIIEEFSEMMNVVEELLRYFDYILKKMDSMIADQLQSSNPIEENSPDLTYMQENGKVLLTKYICNTEEDTECESSVRQCAGWLAPSLGLSITDNMESECSDLVPHPSSVEFNCTDFSSEECQTQALACLDLMMATLGKDGIQGPLTPNIEQCEAMMQKILTTLSCDQEANQSACEVAIEDCMATVRIFGINEFDDHHSPWKLKCEPVMRPAIALYTCSKRQQPDCYPKMHRCMTLLAPDPTNMKIGNPTEMMECLMLTRPSVGVFCVNESDVECDTRFAICNRLMQPTAEIIKAVQSCTVAMPDEASVKDCVRPALENHKTSIYNDSIRHVVTEVFEVWWSPSMGIMGMYNCMMLACNQHMVM